MFRGIYQGGEVLLVDDPSCVQNGRLVRIVTRTFGPIRHGDRVTFFLRKLDDGSSEDDNYFAEEVRRE